MDSPLGLVYGYLMVPKLDVPEIHKYQTSLNTLEICDYIIQPIWYKPLIF